jgi:hypothetical protein
VRSRNGSRARTLRAAEHITFRPGSNKHIKPPTGRKSSQLLMSNTCATMRRQSTHYLMARAHDVEFYRGAAFWNS